MNIKLELEPNSAHPTETVRHHGKGKRFAIELSRKNARLDFHLYDAPLKHVGICVALILCYQQADFASDSSGNSHSGKAQAVSETATKKTAKSAEDEFDPTGSPAEAAGIQSELENISKKPDDYWAYERLGWCYCRSASNGKRYKDNYYALYYWGLLKKRFGKVPETATRDCVNKANEDYTSLKAKLEKDVELGNVLAIRIIQGIEKLFEEKKVTPMPAAATAHQESKKATAPAATAHQESAKAKPPDSLASHLKLKSIFDDTAIFSIDGNDNIRLKIGESYKSVLLKKIEGTTIELEEQGKSYMKRL